MQPDRMRVMTWVATAFCCLWAGSAQAEVIAWTYSGVVDYGYDRAGIFGDNTDLTGRAFSVVERFDTNRNTFRYVDDDQSLQFGGSQRGTPGSASLTVTIGGVARSITDLEDYIYSGSVTGKHLDFVKDSTGYEYAGFYVQSSALAANYATPLTLDPTQALFIGNYQYFSIKDPALATFASFSVANLQVGPITAVPLPGSLALFGVSLLVVAAFRRILPVRAPRHHDHHQTTERLEADAP